MEIKFAFAVNRTNQFEKNHFGDSHKFLIYSIDSGKLKFLSEEKNVLKDMDEKKEHGSRKKGLAIIEYLKNRGVNVLVSRQFGRNIKVINEHFIPVIIYSDEPNDAIDSLAHHLHWIVDELKNTSSNFKLFTIKSGILKSVVNK